MERILVICHLVENRFDGQQSKTNDVIAALKNRGFDVEILNYGKISPLLVLFKSRKIMKRHTNILLMPGGKKALFLYTYLSKFFKQANFYYLAVGGWVVNLIENKKTRKKLKNLHNFKCVVLQNKQAIKVFEEHGFTNTSYIPTFSSKTGLTDIDFKKSLDEFNRSSEFRFCFFARVEESKGIFKACEVFKRINQIYSNVSFDIYGQIQKEEAGVDLQKYLDKRIKYQGVIHDDSIKTLSSYYCMVFPTFYHGEGMAHSIIESFMAGLPVIATDWRFNSELVKEGETGFLISVDNLEEDLFNKIIYVIQNKNLIKNMRNNCFAISKEFDSDRVLKSFIDKIEKN